MAWWKIHRHDKPGGAVLASAALISREQIRSVVGRRQEWQAQGWEWYRKVPELKSGIRWAANGLSRARLYIGKIDPDGSSKPIPIDAAGGDDMTPEIAAKLLAPLEDLAGGQLGQGEMLRRLSVHLDIPGESYLVGYDDPKTMARTWTVCSPSEITTTGGGSGFRIQLPDSQQARLDLTLDTSTLIRLWRPDDEYAYLPDSPLQGLQEPLREIEGLTAHILATVDSRLAGAGLGIISDDVVPATPQQSDGPNPLHSDPVTASLIEAAAASLRDRDSAAALVPLLLRVPGSVEGKFDWTSFATKLDDQVLPLREAAIKRLAIGLDMPPEVLTGLADVNHWNAWEISDDAIKIHHEPKLGLICAALTSQYFRAAWEALGVPDPGRFACWYNVADLKQRPNRSPETLQAVQLGLIGSEAARRELGFADEDAPTAEERNRALVQALVTAAPALAPNLLPYLGITLPETATVTDTSDSTPGGGSTVPAASARPAITPASPPASDAASAPSTGRPEPPQRPITASAAPTGSDWRLRCLDLAVRRALGRAGQWLLNNGGRSLRGRFRGTSHDEIYLHLRAEEHQLDGMLASAYREFHASTPGEDCLHRAVDLYVRRLLLTGIAHESAHLAEVLASADCDEQAA